MVVCPTDNKSGVGGGLPTSRLKHYGGLAGLGLGSNAVLLTALLRSLGRLSFLQTSFAPSNSLTIPNRPPGSSKSLCAPHIPCSTGLWGVCVCGGGFRNLHGGGERFPGLGPTFTEGKEHPHPHPLHNCSRIPESSLEVWTKTQKGLAALTMSASSLHSHLARAA